MAVQRATRQSVNIESSKAERDMAERDRAKMARKGLARQYNGMQRIEHEGRE